MNIVKNHKNLIYSPLRWRLWKHPQRILNSAGHLTGAFFLIPKYLDYEQRICRRCTGTEIAIN